MKRASLKDLGSPSQSTRWAITIASTRLGLTPWAGNINNLLPLSTNDEVLAFEEGFADWFAVAGKTWYKKQPGVNQDAPAALVAMTTGTLFDYGGTIYGGRNTFNINDDNPVYTLAVGSDDEGSVARILWGLTTNSKKPVRHVDRRATLPVHPHVPGPHRSRPKQSRNDDGKSGQPTLDGLTKALGVFVDNATLTPTRHSMKHRTSRRLR